MDSYYVFTVWTSTKPRLMENGIWQSSGLDLVNINVFMKVHQNIPYGSRDRASLSFSEFGPRQSLNGRHIAFVHHLLGLHLVNSNVYATYQTLLMVHEL